MASRRTAKTQGGDALPPGGPPAPAGMPFGALRFLYVGSRDTARDVAHYRGAGAIVHWDVHGFGAHVAAVELGPGPWWLLADHRPAGTVLPVPALRATVERLMAAGWEPRGPVVEVPNGPVRIFRDPSGNEVALLEDRRPWAAQHLGAGGTGDAQAGLD